MREGKHYLAVGTEEQKEEKGKIQGPEYQKRILIETHTFPHSTTTTHTFKTNS